MKKRRLNPLITVLLIAFSAVILTILVLYVFVGYRYISDSEHGIKFIGMTEGGLARDGKLFYSDGTRGTLTSETDTIMLENGEQYTGSLHGFLPNGSGTLKKADGTVYQGTFNMGEATGNALVTYKSGDVYDGEIIAGRRNGWGTYTSKDGSIYTGSFTDNQKNGNGKSSFADGSVYIGQYKNSIKEGFGAYLFKNGDIYVGEFKEDKRTGRGVYIWAKSEEFASEFDEMFLNFEFTRDSEKEFFDYFSTDFNRHFSESDKGEAQSITSFWLTFEKILSRSQVECYTGEFKENLLSGKGTYRWLSGRILTAEFENGDVKEEPSENADENA